jgi:RimJ/RimL family protein N-acetyltransferase
VSVSVPTDRTHVQAPPLRGRRFSLMPLVPEYHHQIYQLNIREQLSFRWRFHGSIPPFDAFERMLYQGVFAQFVVVISQEPRSVVGHVVAYNANLRDGSCHIGVVGDSHAGAGILEAVALFFGYLFVHWPFRKLYMETPEFNASQFGSAVRSGLLREEGRLKDQQFFDGAYWDEVIYAIYRDDALVFREKHPNLFAIGDADA